MRLGSMLLLTALFALDCGRSAPPPAKPSPPARPAAAAEEEDEPASSVPPARERVPERHACLPKTSARTGVVHVEVKAGHALACYLTGDEPVTLGVDYPCLLVDLKSNGIVEAELWKYPEPNKSTDTASGGVPLTTTADTIRVCPKSKACSTVRLKHKPAVAGHGDSGGDSLIAAANEDGSRVFVFAPELNAGVLTAYGDVYKVSTGKRIAHVDLTAAAGGHSFVDPSNDWSARFSGKQLILGDYVCCGPGGTTLLFDPQAKKARVLHGYDGEFLPVGGSVYAVRDGNNVALVDFDKMLELKSFASPSDPVGSPEEPDALMAVEGTTLVVAYANPPKLLTIDANARKAATPLALPLCP